MMGRNTEVNIIDQRQEGLVAEEKISIQHEAEVLFGNSVYVTSGREW